MLRDRSLVEDVIQSAISKAFQKFDRFSEGTDFKAWIFRFVTLEILNQNRKSTLAWQSEFPADLPVEDSWELLAASDTFDAMLENPDVVLEQLDDVLVAALERLTVPERAVLLLRAVGDFSYKEIHELLGIPLGSVIGYLSRARYKLRHSLAAYAAERGLFGRAFPGGKHL
jgi:RNA polymerase sigma-70 factor (ECF subfamily)